jgi:hypothetical protein
MASFRGHCNTTCDFPKAALLNPARKAAVQQAPVVQIAGRPPRAIGMVEGDGCLHRCARGFPISAIGGVRIWLPSRAESAGEPVAIRSQETYCFDACLCTRYISAADILPLAAATPVTCLESPLAVLPAGKDAGLWEPHGRGRRTSLQ